MNLESHVPSRETCEKLKAAGFPQETLFYWEWNGREYQLVFGQSSFAICAAPLLSEILEQFAEMKYSASIGNINLDYLAAATASNPGMVPVFAHSGLPHTNPAEAAAQLYLKGLADEVPH